MNEPEIYICDECIAEGAMCKLKTTAGKPIYCPISGDEMDCDEWTKIEE